MSNRTARLFDWFRIYDHLGYSASGNDSDRDGVPNRADVDSGAVDCSGAVWASYAYAWEPDRPPFPLSSTSGYAVMAQAKGLWVSFANLMPGDVLLHSTNGDVFHSDGPAGHTELFAYRNSDGTWRCAGSSGSGAGVGLQNRRPSFWQRAFRIPGLEDHSLHTVIKPFDLAALLAALQPPEEDMSDLARIPFAGQLHSFWVHAGRLHHVWDDGGKENHEDLSTITGIGALKDGRPSTGITSDGDLLVGCFGANDNALVEVRFDVAGKSWAAHAFGI